MILALKCKTQQTPSTALQIHDLALPKQAQDIYFEDRVDELPKKFKQLTLNHRARHRQIEAEIKK